MSITEITAIFCPHCGAQDPEIAPTYTCSRCSTQRLYDGDRMRCEECHVFMGKDGDQACTECEEAVEEEELVETTMYRTDDDGVMHESRAVAKAWVKSAPERLAQQKEWAVQREAITAARAIERAAQAALLRDTYLAYRNSPNRRSSPHTAIVEALENPWAPDHYDIYLNDEFRWCTSSVHVLPAEYMALTLTDTLDAACAVGRAHWLSMPEHAEASMWPPAHGPWAGASIPVSLAIALMKART